MFYESGSKEKTQNNDVETKFEQKELIDILSLAEKEQQELQEQFLQEHPEYKITAEINDNHVKKVVNGYKLPKWVKLIGLAIPVFLGLGIALAFSNSGGDSIIKSMFILAIGSAIVWLIGVLKNNKNFGRVVDDFSKWQNSSEYKELDNAYKKWLETKGYYMPEDID